MSQFQKYTWLIETIRRAGQISHKELSQRWVQNRDLSNGNPLNRGTFARWKETILSQFGINICCNRAGGYRYYIENTEDLSHNSLQNWMLNSFAVGNVIGENLSLKNRIIVDNIPSGQDHLITIIAAMKENRLVDVNYAPFYNADGYRCTLAPLCVKIFQNRWYVLGQRTDGMIKTYALDRIRKCEATDTTFKMPRNFNIDNYFATYYGIVTDATIKPQRIVIRAYGNHKHYIKSLPLHPSQHQIIDTPDHADFEMYLAPTYDFIMRILHDGADLEVLSPAPLRQEIKRRIGNMANRYKQT